MLCLPPKRGVVFTFGAGVVLTSDAGGLCLPLTRGGCVYLWRGVFCLPLAQGVVFTSGAGCCVYLWRGVLYSTRAGGLGSSTNVELNACVGRSLCSYCKILGHSESLAQSKSAEINRVFSKIHTFIFLFVIIIFEAIYSNLLVAHISF